MILFILRHERRDRMRHLDIIEPGISYDLRSWW